MLVCRYGKSLEALRLDDNRKYLVIHSPWFSYYFWVTECLLRLLMVKEQPKDLVLIYPENARSYTYVCAILQLLVYKIANESSRQTVRCKLNKKYRT